MSQLFHQRYDENGIKKSSAKALETLTSSCCSAISSIKYHVDKAASYLLLYHITANSSSSHILGIWYQSGQGHCLPVKGLLDESHHQLVSSSQVPHHKLSLRTLLQSEVGL
jgi:hypothetical protein